MAPPSVRPRFDRSGRAEVAPPSPQPEGQHEQRDAEHRCIRAIWLPELFDRVLTSCAS